MRQLENLKDAGKYQGHQFTWIGWDELQRWPSLEIYHLIKACLRSSANVPNKRIRATGNPGGAGHSSVFDYLIRPAPLGGKPIHSDHTDSYRMFIPSRVEDNKILLANDPLYIQRLKGVGSPEMVRAWLRS